MAEGRPIHPQVFAQLPQTIARLPMDVDFHQFRDGKLPSYDDDRLLDWSTSLSCFVTHGGFPARVNYLAFDTIIAATPEVDE